MSNFPTASRSGQTQHSERQQPENSWFRHLRDARRGADEQLLKAIVGISADAITGTRCPTRCPNRSRVAAEAKIDMNGGVASEPTPAVEREECVQRGNVNSVRSLVGAQVIVDWRTMGR